MGFIKAGKIIAGGLIIGFVCLFLSTIFNDYLFFKNDVREFLSEQNFELKDNFEIIKNESRGSVDYYHRFELSISESDKKRILEEMTSSEYYKEEITDYLYLPSSQNRYLGDPITVNYQTHTEFKYEFYKPNGKGYSPTYRIISIPKSGNKLIFERIVD